MPGVEPTPLALLLLGRQQRPGLRARRRLPRRPAGRLRPDARRARPRGQGGARRPGLRARPPLPARRGHRVRRRHRRLLQAGAAGRGPPGGGVHRLLRRALHGRVGRHPHRRRTRRCCSPTSPPAARWPTWRRSTRSSSAGTSSPTAGVADVTVPVTLHELQRRHQGLHRPARRHGLHLVQRASGRWTWAFERGEKVLFLPDQHLGRNTAVRELGLSLDDCVVYDPHKPGGGLTVEQLRAATDDPVEGPLLGARPLHRRVGRRRARAGPRRARCSSTPSAATRSSGRRPRRLDRVHHPHARGGARRQRLGDRHRAQPRPPARAGSTPTRRSSSSTRPSASARR